VRVLVVSAWPPWPLTDGGSLVLHHHLRLLAPRHRIRVLAAGRPPGSPLPGEAGALADVDIRWFGPARSGLLEYARRRWASLRTGEPADVFRVEVPSLLTALDDELRRDPPDVVHLHGWSTAHLATRVQPVPAVHHAVDAWEAVVGTQMALPRWRRVIEAGELRKVRRHEMRHHPACAAVAVVAPADADLLRRRAPATSVHVVPNGVDVAADPASPSDAPVLAFHGVLSTVANHHAAVGLVRDVLPRVKASRPDASVRLIGRDPPGDVVRLAGDGVVVTGEVPDVRAELARAAVYVAPMFTGTGIKNKVLEAMASGLPVVGTTRALNGIGPGAGVRLADNHDAIAAAVVALLDDDAARREVGRAGRERVRSEFSWEASAAAIERLWRAAASGEA
jgi:glycosyltransferase involved in cell wall biosynthesis